MAHAHSGHRQRLRERFQETGLDGFQPHELMELLLFYAIPQRDVNPLAHQLVDRFGSVGGVLRAGTAALEVPGVGPHTAAFFEDLTFAMERYRTQRFADQPVFQSQKAAGEYCKQLFAHMDSPRQFLLCLDSGWHLIHCQPLPPQQNIKERTRQIIATAVRYWANYVVLASFRPKGELHPTAALLRETQIVGDALAASSLKLMDHILVSPTEHLSLRKSNSMQESGFEEERAQAELWAAE